MSVEMDKLTKTFVDAAHALADAMVAELGAKDPALAAKVAHALQHGERLTLGLEFALEESAIRLGTLDDYQRVKSIMSIPGKGPVRH